MTKKGSPYRLSTEIEAEIFDEILEITEIESVSFLPGKIRGWKKEVDFLSTIRKELLSEGSSELDIIQKIKNWKEIVTSENDMLQEVLGTIAMIAGVCSLIVLLILAFSVGPALRGSEFGLDSLYFFAGPSVFLPVICLLSVLLRKMLRSKKL